MIFQHLLDAHRIAAQPVGDVEGTGQHALATNALEIMTPPLFRHGERQDGRERDADGQQHEDMPRHRAEEIPHALHRLADHS